MNLKPVKYIEIYKYIGLAIVTLLSTWADFWLAIFWTRYQIETVPGADSFSYFMFFIMAFLLIMAITFALISFIFFKFILKEETSEEEIW